MINHSSVMQYADHSYAASTASVYSKTVRTERDVLSQPDGYDLDRTSTRDAVGDEILPYTAAMNSGVLSSPTEGSYLPLELARLVSLIGSQQLKSLDSKQTDVDYSQDQQQPNCRPCDFVSYADNNNISNNNSIAGALEGRLHKLYQIRRLTLAPTYPSLYDLQVTNTINQKIQALESELMSPEKEPILCHIVSDNNQYQMCSNSKK